MPTSIATRSLIISAHVGRSVLNFPRIVHYAGDQFGIPQEELAAVVAEPKPVIDRIRTAQDARLEGLSPVVDWTLERFRKLMAA